MSKTEDIKEIYRYTNLKNAPKLYPVSIDSSSLNGLSYEIFTVIFGLNGLI
jgi:hypothetical protein